MDATRLLESQHREVEKLFARFERAKNKPSEKKAIFEDIADNLAAHATIEEKILYPAIFVGELKDKLKEAVEEHLGIKRVIADLLVMAPTDENYDAKVKVLSEQVEHHVEEEEEDLFPKVRKSFSAAELEALADKMLLMFEDLIDEDPRNDVPSETDEAAPIR